MRYTLLGMVLLGMAASVNVVEAAVLVTEIHPNPIGSDTTEFIELANDGTEIIDLESWQLDDAEGGTSPHTISGIQLAPNEVRVFMKSETGIGLNNTSDQVRVFNAAGVLIQEVSYTGIPEGKSFSRQSDGSYKEEDPSKGSFAFQNSTPLPRGRGGGKTPVFAFSDQVSISEVFPNPKGKDSGQEFIELYYDGELPFSLAGWSLDDEDGGSNPYAFKEAYIAPKSYFVVSDRDSKIILNNTKDTVRLIDPSGKIISELSIDQAPEGQSINIIGHESLWLDPTPGRPVDQGKKAGEPRSRAQNYQHKFRHLEITEVFPNPKGNDRSAEWIELFNKGFKSINLYGLKLKIHSQKSKDIAIPFQTFIPAQSHTVLSSKALKFSLDNQFEKIEITSPTNETLVSTSWHNAPVGMTWSKQSDGGWRFVSSSTKGEKNQDAQKHEPDCRTQKRMQGKVGQKIEFELVCEEGFETTKVYWDFDDDTPRQKGRKTSHEFVRPGTFNVEGVIEYAGETKTKTILVTIWPKEIAIHPILVTELNTNPRGDIRKRQWIEVLNRTDEPFFIEELVINEKAQKMNTWIKHRGYQMVKASLPTTGKLNIIGPLELPLVDLTIPEVQKGQTISRDTNGEWKIDPHPSPGRPNNLKQLSDLQQAESKDELLAPVAVVTVPPNLLFKKTFFTQSPNAKMVVKDVDASLLEIGRRIKIQDKSVLEVLDIVAPEKVVIKPDQLDELEKYTLIEMEGFIEKVSKTQFFVDGVKIAVKKETQIDTSELSVGDQVRITGIIDETSSGRHILPRSTEDIQVRPMSPIEYEDVVQDELPAAVITERPTHQENEKKQDSDHLRIYLKIGLAILLPIMLILGMNVYSKKYDKSNQGS